MQQIPSISIVIPAYNNAPHLGDAIDSALRTKGPMDEIIVVDDASTDDTRSVVGRYGGQIHYLRQSENRGGASSRNVGIEHASGQFVQFLDADDVLVGNWQQSRLQRYIEDKSAGCFGVATKIYFGDLQAMNSSGEQLHDWKSSWRSGADGAIKADLDLLSRQLATPQPLYPIDALKKVGGFSPGLRRGQERDLNLRLIFSGCEFEGSPGAVCRVRHHAHTTRMGSAASRRRHPFAMMDYVARIYELLQRQYGTVPAEQRNFLSADLLEEGRRFLRDGAKDYAKMYFAAGKVMCASAAKLPMSTKFRIGYRLFGPVAAERIAAAMRDLSPQ